MPENKVLLCHWRILETGLKHGAIYLTMQAQTIHKGPPAQPSVLPPLQNLPSWSRSSLERRRQPRPIVRDQQSIDPSDEAGDDKDIGGMVEHQKNVLSLNEPRIVSAPSRTGEKDLRQKVTEMEKSLDFVQNEHAQVLKNLHEEIERLKAENKGNDFCYVINKTFIVFNNTLSLYSFTHFFFICFLFQQT